MRDDPTAPIGPPLRDAVEGRVAWRRILDGYDVCLGADGALWPYRAGSRRTSAPLLILAPKPRRNP